MNAKQILFYALSLVGMSRFYREAVSLLAQGRDADRLKSELEYYYNQTGSDISICQIVRGILFDSVPEMYQVLK